MLFVQFAFIFRKHMFLLSVDIVCPSLLKSSSLKTFPFEESFFYF